MYDIVYRMYVGTDGYVLGIVDCILLLNIRCISGLLLLLLLVEGGIIDIDILIYIYGPLGSSGLRTRGPGLGR